MKLKNLFLMIPFVLIANAMALTPPMPDDELAKVSTHIVEAKVVAVEANGKPREDDCKKVSPLKAILNPIKFLKGQKLSSMEIRFNAYDYKEGCVGSNDGYHFKGQHRIYYLNCKESDCRMVHWNGMKRVEK